MFDTKSVDTEYQEQAAKAHAAKVRATAFAAGSKAGDVAAKCAVLGTKAGKYAVTFVGALFAKQ
jgi:hypothetical protein